MRYQRFVPPAPLLPYVQYFWSVAEEATACRPRRFRTIADGCPGLIYQPSESGSICTQDGKPWPAWLLHGQATQPSEMYVQGPLYLVGACLQPSALIPVFGVPARGLTDACVDVLDLPAALSHGTPQLMPEAALPVHIRQLASLLLASLGKNHQWAEPGVEYAVTQLLESGGQVPLTQLQRVLGVSERSFQRRFRHYVGVPPKLFARICRFQASLRQLRAAQYTKLSDLAFEHEYADQSHHIRAFQEFAGASPYQFRQGLREVVDNFAELL